jgi:hypothetical protein
MEISATMFGDLNEPESCCHEPNHHTEEKELKQAPPLTDRLFRFSLQTSQRNKPFM